jgi:hypothetical protein
MKIVVIKTDQITIDLEFDPVEVDHTLFTPTKEAITTPKETKVLDEDIRPLSKEDLTLFTQSADKIKADLTTIVEVTEAPTKEGEEEVIKEEEVFIEPATIPETSIIRIEQPLTHKEDPMVELGKFVDSIREKYCGDVIPEEIDKETEEPIPKDMSKIPQFTIGSLETVDKYEAIVAEALDFMGEVEPIEPIKEEEPVIKETPTEEEVRVIK